HAHPFGGKNRKTRAGADAGKIARAIEVARAEGRVNAEKPEDAQVVLGDPLIRVAYEAHAFGANVLKSANMVVHDAGGVDRHAVDGKVTPLRIHNPVAPERDFGLAAECFGILAQRGDLKWLRIDDQRHRAVIDAGRHGLDASRLGAADHFARQGRGRDIDLAYWKLQKRIADGATDHARFLAIAVQQAKHAGGWTGSEPGRVIEHAHI